MPTHTKILKTGIPLVILLITVAGCSGPEGDPGTPGTACWDLNENAQCDVDTEDINGDGECTVADCSTAPPGTIEGTVVDEAGAGIGGAALAADPGGGSTTADALGAFSLTVPIGVFAITASAAGYESATVEFISVAGGGVVTLDPIVLTAENPLTVDAGASQYQVGYGATVNLAGTASGASSLTYEWTQTSGPSVTIGGADTLTPTVTMPTLDAVLTSLGRALPDRTEILPISPGTQGKVMLQLEVSGGGFSATDTVDISAAEPTGSVLDVPVGINVFFVGAESTSYAWTLTPPGGSSAALRAAGTRTPSFIPDVAGTYALSLSGGPSFSVDAGQWKGYVGFEAGCTSCHNGTPAPDQFTPYAQTAHASMFSNAIDGGAGAGYSAGCISCHTVGYSGAAENGGFDDAAAADGWTFPAALEAGNWDAMRTSYPNVARLANIQCENCHGPHDSAAHMQGAPRMSMKEGMCGQCHDAPSHHIFPSEWLTTPHSNLELAREEGTFEARGTGVEHCGRCHAGQGFLVYAANLAEGNSGNITGDEAYFRGIGLEDSEVEAITCQACHDPHSAASPSQLRVYDDIAMLPSGFGVTGVGKGALCMSCHNTRNGLHDDQHPTTSYSGPHTPAQADILMGYNAYFVGRPGYSISGHAAIADTCVACHMASPGEESGASYGGHTWTIGEGTCYSCHGEGVNGEAFMGAVEARLADIDSAIVEQVVGDLTDIVSGGGSYAIRAWDPVTDCYSSSSSSTSNITLSQIPTSATLEHIHGQTGSSITIPAGIDVTWGSTGCSGTTTGLTTLYFQIGSLKSGGAAVIASSDILVQAAWNASLILGDGSSGIHNPTFVMDVLEATYEAVANRP